MCLLSVTLAFPGGCVVSPAIRVRSYTEMVLPGSQQNELLQPGDVVPRRVGTPRPIQLVADLIKGKNPVNVQPCQVKNLRRQRERPVTISGQ